MLSTTTVWLPRLVLALVAAATAAASTLAGVFDGETPYHLEIELAPSAGGMLQVFYDRGGGITPAESAATAIAPSGEPDTYRLPLPLGRFHLLRLDPGDRPGRYVLTRLRIVDDAGREVHAIPLDRLEPAVQVHVEPLPHGLAIVTAPDANDPQVVYREPFVLAPPDRDLAGTLVRALAAAGLALAMAGLLDRQRLTSAIWRVLASTAARRPSTVVAAAGLAGTLLATYPLLLGRSLVSPSIGPTHLLYDQPPFAFGSADRGTENARGTDVGAMMWAILPYTVVQREALAHGEWPLWNRYNGIGEPLWGQGQTFVLDPVHAASLLIPDAALAMDLRFIVARVVFAVGAGLAVLAVTGQVTAAVLVALMAPFVGHFTARFNHPAYFSIVYVPWLLLAYARLNRAQTLAERARGAAWLALATWLQLVGSTPKEGIVALAGAHLAGVAGLLATRDSWSRTLGRLDAVAVAGVVAILLGAPHWLVFMDTLDRTQTLYGQPAVQLTRWADLVAYALGAVTPGQPQTGVHPLAVMAAAGALAFPRRLARRGPALGAAVAIAALAGVAGGAVPVAFLLRLPLVANIHHLGPSLLSATIGPLLLLAGVGLSFILEASRGRVASRAVLVAGAGLVIAGLLAARAATFVSLLAAAAVAGASMAMAVLAIPVAATSSVAGAAAAACLAVCAGGLHGTTGWAGLDAVLIQPRRRVDLSRPSPALDAIRRRAGAEPFRVAPVEGVLFPGTQALWRLEGIGGPDALRLPGIESLLDAAGVGRTSWGWRTVLRPDHPPRVGRLLDMLNVRFLVARPDQAPAGLSPLPVEGDDVVRGFERPTAWPRAFYAAGVGRHDGVVALVDRLAATGGPFASVDERDLPAGDAIAGLPGTGPVVAATAYRLTANTTSFRVRTPGPGLAVLAEALVDGDVMARVNGRPAPAVRVNHAFKAVRIPAAGDWDVVFEYRPARWGLAWALAAAGALLCASLLLAVALLPKRPQAS